MRAELLRRWQPRADRAAWEGVPAPLGTPAEPSAEPCAPLGESVGEEAMQQAIAAAQAAGLQDYRVEAGPDGQVLIVVGTGASGPAEPEAQS